MASLNKTELIGYIGQDPDIRYMPNGDPVATISLGTTETWKNKDGEPQEHTEWHRLVFYGKIVENVIAKYLKKGSQIYVEGRNRTRKWTDKNKIDRYTTEIVCDNMQMLDRKPSGDTDKTMSTPPDGFQDSDIPM